MISLQLAITIIQLVVCLILIVVVMFQSGKSAGLSGAIGGSGSDTFMSKNKAKSMDAKLAKATKWIAVVFVVLTLILNIIAE